MITEQEMQARIDNFVLYMLDKGLIRPSITFTVNSNAQCYLIAYYDIVSGDRQSIVVHATFEAALEELQEHIDELGTLEEYAMKVFMEQLSKAIEIGRSIGIETKFLNPLEATIKKLSNNILTHKK